MTRNNIGQFTRSFWSKIVSTFKFTIWFIKLIFSKDGLKQIIWVLGLSLAVAFLLIQIMLTGWNQAVDLTTKLFDKPISDLSINVPHAQETIPNLIRWNFGSQAKLATAIFTAESGLHCNSISDTHDYGLAQINIQAHPQYTTSQLLDCKTNIEAAALIYHQQGNFNAWTAYKTGAYKRYLN